VKKAVSYLNSNLKFIVITLFGLMGLFYSGYWINTHWSEYYQTVETSLPSEVVDNPLLVAQWLLERMGSVVITKKSVIDIQQLESQDTLILWESDKLFTTTQTQQLLEWVEAGGHLIIASNTVYASQNSANPLLQALKIYRLKDSLEYLSPDQIIPTTPFIWENDSIQVIFDPHYRLEYIDDPAIEIGDDYGTHLLLYYYGTGMISILSDMQFIHNQAIGKYDHAQFLWLLVNFERLAQRVWLLPHFEGMTQTIDNIPSLSQLIWDKRGIVAISASILLGLWYGMSSFALIFGYQN
jgi:hypothetical protein